MNLQQMITQLRTDPPTKAKDMRELMDEAMTLPLLAPIRLFWENFQSMRPWWPVLIPLLLWVSWRSYRAERKRITGR